MLREMLGQQVRGKGIGHRLLVTQNHQIELADHPVAEFMEHNVQRDVGRED